MPEKDIGYTKNLQKDETLFREGDEGDEMYLIKSGEIKITTEVEGKEKTLAVLNEGAFFGEMALIDNRPRSASAIAKTDCKLIIVDREAFLRKVNENPFIKYIIGTLSKRLRKTDEMLRYLSISNKKTRLIIYLRRKAEENDDGSGVNIDTKIPLDIEKISDTIGIEPEETRKILSALKKYDIIGEDKNVIVKSLRKLQKYEDYIALQEEFSS